MRAVIDIGLAADIVGLVNDRRQLAVLRAEVRRLLTAEREHIFSFVGFGLNWASEYQELCG